MNLLVDTHVAIWAVLDSRRLSEKARAAMSEPGVRVHVSVVSVWEIAIKHALGQRQRDPIPLSGRQALRGFEMTGFRLLPITAAHAAAVDDLPPVHGDPFDRMLVAQALAEPMRLLTRDARLKEYGEDLVIPA